MYSVHQHWDKLKVCVVGKSYPPDFYSYITNPRVRRVMERIAIETEEDYQKLISLLESFDVKIMRPELKDSIEYYKSFSRYATGRYAAPPMNPRDDSGMFGNTLFMNNVNDCYTSIIEHVKQTNPVIIDKDVNTAIITRVGKDLYIGTETPLKDAWTVIKKKGWPDDPPPLFKWSALYNTFKNKNLEIAAQINLDKLKYFSDYRCNIISSEGHTDSAFCPVVPGLIISLCDIQRYEKTFPNWEVIYLPNQSWSAVDSFLRLKEKNKGKWWVPGEELNDDFTEFVENWLTNWVGYVEETVFDVNMLVIDKKNVVCNNYNKAVFDAFERYGITPHVINFRHRYFWDGGLHCITSDLDREGVLEDYFPERGEP